MAFKIKIISPGKIKEKWLDEAMAEYIKRLKNSLEIESVWVKNDAQLLDVALKEKSLICLDPVGKLYDSSKFSQYLIQQLIENDSRLSIVIGGPEGLPAKLKEYPLLSLSPLTLTHQMVRLLLVEQIYRAIEIEKGSKYHK